MSTLSVSVNRGMIGGGPSRTTGTPYGLTSYPLSRRAGRWWPAGPWSVSATSSGLYLDAVRQGAVEGARCRLLTARADRQRQSQGLDSDERDLLERLSEQRVVVGLVQD